MGQFEVLKKIQEIELDALKEFNKICKENNLMFFLRGGSVMGAVKYQGFIPWDDDVDIAVPREDYDQLPQIFENKIIAGKYQVLCHQYCEELHCYFPRLFLFIFCISESIIVYVFSFFWRKPLQLRIPFYIVLYHIYQFKQVRIFKIVAVITFPIFSGQSYYIWPF